MESVANSPAVQTAGNNIANQLTGVGAGFTIMILALALSLAVNYLQWKANRDLVDKMLNLMPTWIAAVQQAVKDFKEGMSNVRS
jgi:hypothetical protein